jgi:hypothetical protein
VGYLPIDSADLKPPPLGENHSDRDHRRNDESQTQLKERLHPRFAASEIGLHCWFPTLTLVSTGERRHYKCPLGLECHESFPGISTKVHSMFRIQML